MIKKLFVILGFLLPLIGQGQMIYDTLDLEAVEILSRQFDQSAGYKVLAVDTAALQSRSSGSLAELLSGSTPMFVKGYGPGSLASTSIRGASAAHTQVIWNGMNINSPMPGQTDFSTVPVFFIDRATMYFGAGSVQQTSGGLGGAIDLETKPTWQNKLRIGLQQDAGSFKTYKTLFSADAGNEVFQSSTRLLRGSSENDFPYLNIAVSRDDPPREIRKNAAWQQQGLLQQLYWKPGTRTLLSGKVWLQKNHREIPANILVQVPDATNLWMKILYGPC